MRFCGRIPTRIVSLRNGGESRDHTEEFPQIVTESFQSERYRRILVELLSGSDRPFEEILYEKLSRFVFPVEGLDQFDDLGDVRDH